MVIRLLALLAILGAALVLLGLVGVAILAGHAGHDVATTEPERHGTSSDLVVILHDMSGSPRDMHDIRDVVAARRPDADILMPRYDAGPFANTDLREVARVLDRRIQALVDRATLDGHRYRRIVLVGHGIGALVARRAYLYGKGYRSDYTPAGERDRSNPWVDGVDRVVTLAGMNRGWTTDTRPPGRSAWQQLLFMLGERIARATGTGEMMLSVERGSPLLTNLRTEWIRLAREDGAPPVIQLLGDGDGMVSAEDDADEIAAPRFMFVKVLGADHGNLIQFGDSPENNLRRRRQKFIEALTADIDTLEASYPPNRALLAEEPEITHVVFIKHGIRDMAVWADRLRRLIERKDPTVKVIVPKYESFPMASFLLFADRQQKVREFADEYTQALARYPHADRFSFIGHSNGTYLLASALEHYEALRFHRVYFAGSVVRRDFEWDRYQDRLGDLRNDMAAEDWVVAIFPRVFEQVRQLPWAKHLAYFEVGSGGFNGFEKDFVNGHEFAYFRGGHSAALDEAMNVYSVADFIVEEDLSRMPAPVKLLPTGAPWLELATDFAWLAWLAMLAAVIGIGYVLWRLAPARGAVVGLYVAGLVALMYAV